MSDFAFDFEMAENEINFSDTVVSEPEPVVDSPTARDLVAKEKELKALEASIEPQETELTEVRRELKRLREETAAAIELLTKRERAIELEIYDTKRTIRALTREIESLRRKLQLELEQRRKTLEFKENAVGFNKLIQNFKYSDDILLHQKEGAFILATNGRSILGDERGLGKTLTSLATADMLQANKVLVLCPDDVVSNFVNEIHSWSPHRDVFSVGKMPKSQRDFAFKMAKNLEQFIIVCNYSAWRKDKSIISSMIDLHLDMVIADEAHELKNVTTSAYNGVQDIVLAENVCPICQSTDIQDNIRPVGGIGSYYSRCSKCEWNSNDGQEYEPLSRCSVKYVFPMTGTVILNKPQDLFALLHLVDPIIFATERQFLDMYCTRDYYSNKWTFLSGGLDRLSEKLSGKFLQRKRGDTGVVIPKQSVITHEIEFDKEKYPKQWKVIEQLSKHAQIILDSGRTLNNLITITLILRKRQANVWPGGIKLKNEKGDVVFDVSDDVHESIKVDKCIEFTKDGWEGLIPEFTENGDTELGSRVVVFSQFKPPLEELERRCNAAGISVARFDGDTPEDIRVQIKEDVDRRTCEKPEYIEKHNGYRFQVVLCNYRTGGVGLNFTAMTETIFMDEEWNPGKADQAMGRTDRIGQTEETNVHILRVPGTIDTWMKDLNDEKADIISGFENSTKDTAKSLLDAMRSGEII